MWHKLHVLLADTSLMLSKCCVVQNTFVGPAMSLFAIILVLLLFSRGVFIFPILIAHNYFSKDKLPFRQMVVAWCAHITQAHIHHSCRAMFFTEVLFAQKHSLHRSTLRTNSHAIHALSIAPTQRLRNAM